MFAKKSKERKKASITDQKIIMSDSKSSSMALNSSISVDSSHPLQRLQRGPVLNRCRSDIQPTSSQSSADSALENLVRCAICSRRLIVPKMLNCQHTFCLECLETELSNSPDKCKTIICPTCSAKMVLPLGITLSELPNNLYINSLIQVLKEQTNSVNQQRCFRCKTKCATLALETCCHCTQQFCNICWSTHMNDLSKQIEELNVQLNLSVEKMSHKLENYKVQFDKLNEKICTVFDEKILALQNKKQELLDESQQLYHTGENEHKKLAQKIEALKISISNAGNGQSMDSGKNVMKIFLSLHTELSELINKISQWGEERTLFNLQNLTIEVHSKVHGNGTGSKSETMTPTLARRRQNYLITEEAIENYYRNKQFKSVLIWSKCTRPSGVGIAPWTHKDTNLHLLYIAGTESRLIYGVSKVNGNILHEISHDNMIFPHAIGFSKEREEIFVSDKWKHCIFVFSKYGDLLRVLGGKGDAEGFLRAPEGIAIGSNNAIFVCDTGNDRIQCLNIQDGRMMMQFGLLRKDQMIKAVQTKTICRSVDLNSPTAIALFNDLIIVLDTGNKRVKTFNKFGEIIHEFGQLGTLNGQFKHPEALAVDSHGFIFIGDSGNARVQVFRQNGEFLTALGSRGVGHCKFNWVSGIHISENFEIIVSDYKNHAVQVIK